MSKRKLEENGEEAREVKVKKETVTIEDEESDVKVKVEPTVKTEPDEQKTSGDDIVCPYLDTIDRKVLDFDFEKLCSVSLASLNVYACLVCGKYFQGRGKNTHAYTHSLEADHHVFINLETEKIYCLPDGYEVKDTSLSDIQYNLHPRFSKREVKQFDLNKTYTHALDGTDYLPGVVGLNNVKSTDWLNVVVQALSRVPILREYFTYEQNYLNSRDSSEGYMLCRRFGEILCKMWNNRNFKGHVSPHEILQIVASYSQKKYKIGVQSDPLQFMSWFLHSIHKATGGTKKRTSSPVSRSFQGEITMYTDTISGLDEEGNDKVDTKAEKKPFLYLSLELPPAPLFKDSMDHNIIPQVPLFDLLSKFDGETVQLQPDGSKRRYQISRLPKFLIIHVKRFTENNWFVEKNPTLVNFPIKNLDMKTFLKKAEVPSTEDLETKSVKELKAICAKRKIDVKTVVEKDELIGKVVASYATQKEATKYDLIANICHDGKPDKGTYRVHTFHEATDTWYELQDLHVWSTETMPQLVALSETYIQIYALQKP